MKTISASTRSTVSVWRCQWLGWTCLAILLLFTWLPYSYRAMVSWHWIAVWQLGFLCAGIWLIGMLRQFQVPFRLLGYGLDWVVAWAAIALVLSTLFAPFPQVAAWNSSMALSYGVLLYAFRNWLGQSWFTLERIWAGIVLVGVGTSLVGLIMSLQSSLESGKFPNFSNAAPFGNQNFVAGYLVLVLPLSIAWALSHRGRQKFLGFLGSATIAVALYTTHSRGGLLGISVLILVALGFLLWRSRGKQRQRLLIGAVLALITMSLILLSNPKVRRLTQVSPPNADSQPALTLVLDNSIRDRLFMWQSSLNILQDRPLLGVGSGNMSRVYNLYRPIEAGRSSDHVHQLHNTVVQLLGELGLVGIGAYFFLLGCLARLWMRLYQQLQHRRDRWLLYGTGGSLLAYAVSSLTDYQLENIGISSVLVLLIVLLIGVAQRHHLSNPTTLPSRQRRFFSLGGITALFLALWIWLPVTIAMYFSWDAYRDFAAGKTATSINKWEKAAALAPWDPTYPLLAGFPFLRSRDSQKPEQAKELTKAGLNHLEEALEAAPYDAAFNYNLGRVYLDLNHAKAERYLSRSAQLVPRNALYTYYWLGRSYLSQQQIEKAITAFTLQSLVDPQFLTLSVWSNPPLSNFKNAVLEGTLEQMNNLLAEIPKDDPNYNQLYQQKVILRWWHDLPLHNLHLERLTPTTQAALLVEKSPQKAIAILNTELQATPKRSSLLFFRAWMNPEKYLEAYFQQHPDIDSDRKQQLRASIKQHRSFQGWLKSIQTENTPDRRHISVLTYRNSNLATNVVISDEAPVYPLALKISLYNKSRANQPKFFPQLDQLINKIRTEQLNLPHPTENNFQV